MTKTTFPTPTERTFRKVDYYYGEKLYIGMGYHEKNVVGPIYDREVLLEVRDKPNEKEYRHADDVYYKVNGALTYTYSYWRSSKQKKSLCIGGPLDGTMQTTSDAADYSEFNSSGRSSKHKTVLVYDLLLGY